MSIVPRADDKRIAVDILPVDRYRLVLRGVLVHVLEPYHAESVAEKHFSGVVVAHFGCNLAGNMFLVLAS